MSKPVHTIEEDTSTQQAALKMSLARRGFLVVTKDGKPTGIVSDSDIIRKVVANNEKPNLIKVKDIMNKPIVSISPDDDIMRAVKKIKANNIHRLPVVYNKEVVGVISLTDIAKTSPEMMDLLEHRLQMKKFPTVIMEKTTLGMCESCGRHSGSLINRRGEWLCEECGEEMEH